MKYFIYIIILIVAVAIVAGFFIVGSPNQERLRRFDERRVQDLQTIQSQIIYYWQQKNQLPASLANLTDNINGFVAPTDPETNKNYDYQVKGALAFTLCADFNLVSSATSPKVMPIPASYAPGYYSQQNWQHEAGHVCFDRTIDRDFYKPPKMEPKM